MKWFSTLALAIALLFSIGHGAGGTPRIHRQIAADDDSAPESFGGSPTVHFMRRREQVSEYDASPPGESSEAHTPEGGRPSVPAVVSPADRIRVRAAASGTIAELPVSRGQAVSAGHVLCRIRSDEVLADLKQRAARVAAARCRVREAQADLELAEYELELKEDLSLANATPRAEFVAAKLRVRSASARVDAAKEELAAATHGSEMVEKSLERYRAVASSAGRVTEILGRAGQYVGEGDTLLWMESHEKRLRVHLPAEQVRRWDRIEVSILVRGAWRVIGNGVPQPHDNPDGTVTVLLDLGRTDEFASGQILQADAGPGGSDR